MSKVLYIKANAKLEGESRTFKTSDSFIYQPVKPRGLAPEDVRALI